MQSPFLLCIAASVIAPPAAPQEILYEQDPGLYADEVESVLGPGGYSEAADDFDLTAEITRVSVPGWSGAFSTEDPVSVRVRFYAWTPAGPGALEHETHLQAGDPGLHWTPGPGTVDVTLAESFHAAGKHFLSVQVETKGTGFTWWRRTANDGGPVGAPLHFRDSPDGAWGLSVPGFFPPPPGTADLGIELWGADGTPFGGGSDPCGPFQVVDAPVDGSSDVFLRAVDGVAPDDVWAVARGPIALHWDGASWTEVPTPSPEPYPGGGEVSVDAVRAIASDDVWAAGSYKAVSPDGFVGFQIFTMHWDGAAWTHVPAPMTTGATGSGVQGIDARASDDVWFVGEWVDATGGVGVSTSLAMHWDGNAFTRFATPITGTSGGGTFGNGQSLRSVSMLSSSDVWAVGGGGDGDPTPGSNILHWDGAAWEHVPGPAPGDLNELHAVEAIAPDDVWACGIFHDPAQPFFLHWDGASWTQVPSPGGGMGLLARSSDDVLSVGGLFGGTGIVRWDGRAWSEVVDFAAVVPDPNLVALGAPVGLQSLAGCEVWAVGRSNSVLPSHDALAIHLAPAGTGSVAVREPCTGASIPSGLSAAAPPAVGDAFQVALDDPSDAAGLSAGSLALWLVTLDAGPSYPCGLVAAGFGPGSTASEILIDPTLATLVLASAPAAWGGPGLPVEIDVPVPDVPSLEGLVLFSQGAFVDPAAAEVALTNALDLTIGG